MNAEFLLRRVTLGALGAFAFAACGVSDPSVGMIGGPSDGQSDGSQGDGDDPYGGGDGTWGDGDEPYADGAAADDGCNDCAGDGSHSDGSGDGSASYGDGWSNDGSYADGSYGDGVFGDGFGSPSIDASVEPPWPLDASVTE